MSDLAGNRSVEAFLSFYRSFVVQFQQLSSLKHTWFKDIATMRFFSTVWRDCFTENGQKIRPFLRNVMLCFPEFATCRLLHVSPFTQSKVFASEFETKRLLSLQSPTYKALFEISMHYFKADLKGISDCITRYRMAALMGDMTETSFSLPHELELVNPSDLFKKFPL